MISRVITSKPEELRVFLRRGRCRAMSRRRDAVATWRRLLRETRSVRIAASDRVGRERLLRYCARPLPWTGSASSIPSACSTRAPTRSGRGRFAAPDAAGAARLPCGAGAAAAPSPPPLFWCARRRHRASLTGKFRWEPRLCVMLQLRWQLDRRRAPLYVAWPRSAHDTAYLRPVRTWTCPSLECRTGLSSDTASLRGSGCK